MALRGTDPESYITECIPSQEDKSGSHPVTGRAEERGEGVGRAEGVLGRA